MADPKQLVHMLFEKPLLDRLDDFRFKYRFESRSDTARWLLEWALAQNPEVSEILPSAAPMLRDSAAKGRRYRQKQK